MEYLIGSGKKILIKTFPNGIFSVAVLFFNLGGIELISGDSGGSGG